MATFMVMFYFLNSLQPIYCSASLKFGKTEKTRGKFQGKSPELYVVTALQMQLIPSPSLTPFIPPSLTSQGW